MKSDMKVRHIKIEEELWEKLKTAAYPESVSVFIRMALREYVENQKTI